MGYNENEDYCTFAPDGLFGVRFNSACYLHDRQYRNETKNRLTRAEADAKLRDDIIEIYKSKGKAKIGFIVGWIYYLAVRIFSSKLWK